MVYGRQHGEQELNFEASGGLLDASLVMRDRETDSWWSIMTSDAIGGELHGKALDQLPMGEKLPWGEWRQRHPDTLVLSVDGVEHDDTNPYDNYFASDGTFRDMPVDDDRLPAKAPVYSFWIDGQPHAIAHSALSGATLFDLGDSGRALLHRDSDAPIYASSDAFLIPADFDAELTGPALLAAAREGAQGITRLSGFDTFWYIWTSVNPQTELHTRAAE